MTLQDVYNLAAFYLKIPEGDDRAEMLKKCCNLIYRSTAQNFLPLEHKETVHTQGGVLFFKDLSRDIIFLKGVTGGGMKISYKVFPDRIETAADPVTVRYTYLPAEVEGEGVLDYTGKSGRVGARLLAFGAAAEFCLICGLYDDAAVWDARYNEAVRAAQRKDGETRIKGRKWT
jgi:hypothetical protein